MSGVARNTEADAIKVDKSGSPPSPSYSVGKLMVNGQPLMALALSSSNSSCSGRKLGRSPVL